MLLVRGKLTYRNLNTTYTPLDQLVAGLEKERFTGYCTLMFPDYAGALFLRDGAVVNGRETVGGPVVTVRGGEPAVAGILAKGRDNEGDINAYALPADRVAILSGAADSAPKYAHLSTDLTSLDRLMAICKKELLSGYLEIVFEQGAGTANLFFVNGRLTDAIFAPVDSGMVGDAIGLDQLIAQCQTHGAAFTVYRANPAAVVNHEPDARLQGDVPDDALRLFEAVFVRLEAAIDAAFKPGEFQTLFKRILTQLDGTYDFLDPFLGDFRYANRRLTYTGDVDYQGFVEGVCALAQNLLAVVFEQTPRAAFLSRLATALESVPLDYADLIDHLDLETRLPDLFRDEAFFHEPDDQRARHEAARAILNLQSGGVPDIGSESILREVYRVLTLVAQKYIVDDRATFQYARFKKSPEYQQYQTAAALLQNFDITLITRPEAALAFWMNLYDFLVIDGIAKYGITTSVRAHPGFFSATAYRLGDYVFSLDDIKHGILRNNRRRPYSRWRPFGARDPRLSFCVTPPEPAIHCCLVAGTVSSPGLRLYTPRQLSTQMAQAVNHFLTSDRGMRVNFETREVRLNRTLYWYHQDFQRQGLGVLDFVIQALEDTEVKQFLARNRSQLTLRFSDYDWNLNAS